MDPQDKLAYFLEESLLRGVFADWPAGMAVVLCLDDAGGYEILVHRQAEGRAVLRRAAAVLGRPLGQFAVAPPIEGYPTRRVLFSQEQQLLALVAQRTDLPALAADRAENRRFADEAEDHFAPARPRPRRGGFVLPKGIRRGPEPPVLPAGYFLSDGRDADECRIVPARIEVRAEAVRLQLDPARLQVNTRPQRVAEVGFRDDFARFVLPRSALRGWAPGQPAVLDVPLEHFPPGLAEWLSQAPRNGEVTITRRGIFVQPQPRGAAAASAPAAPPAPEPRPSWLRRPAPVAAALVLAVGLGGGVLGALNRPGQLPAPVQEAAAPIDLAPEAPGALELISALAREEARGQVE